MKRYLIIALLALVLPISLKAQVGPILGVEVEKEIIPKWCWYSVIFNMIVLCWILFKVYRAMTKV